MDHCTQRSSQTELKNRCGLCQEKKNSKQFFLPWFALPSSVINQQLENGMVSQWSNHWSAGPTIFMSRKAHSPHQPFCQLWVLSSHLTVSQFQRSEVRTTPDRKLEACLSKHRPMNLKTKLTHGVFELCHHELHYQWKQHRRGALLLLPTCLATQPWQQQRAGQKFNTTKTHRPIKPLSRQALKGTFSWPGFG